MQRRRRWGGRGARAPPSFGISVNPIRTKGGRLCPPYYYWPPHLFGRCGVSEFKTVNIFQRGRPRHQNSQQTDLENLLQLVKNLLIDLTYFLPMIWQWNLLRNIVLFNSYLYCVRQLQFLRLLWLKNRQNIRWINKNF